MIPQFADTLVGHSERTLVIANNSSLNKDNNSDSTGNHQNDHKKSSGAMEGPVSKKQKGDDMSHCSGSSHSTTSTTSVSSCSSSSGAYYSECDIIMPASRAQQQQQQQSPQQQHQQRYDRNHAKSAMYKKHVSFAPVTAIHSNVWPREVVDSCWYTKDELAVLKLDRKALVKALKKVHFDVSQIDLSQHCLRGYEAYLSIQANKEYKAKRQMVWESVLREQARQRHLRIKDALMMQLVSSHATQWARDTATELGMNDAQVALQIFLEYIQEQQEDIPEDDDNDNSYTFDESFDEGRLLEMPLPLEEEEEGLSLQQVLDESLQVTSDCFEPLALSFDHMNNCKNATVSNNNNSMANNFCRMPSNLSTSASSLHSVARTPRGSR